MESADYHIMKPANLQVEPHVYTTMPVDIKTTDDALNLVRFRDEAEPTEVNTVNTVEHTQLLASSVKRLDKQTVKSVKSTTSSDISKSSKKSKDSKEPKESKKSNEKQPKEPKLKEHKPKESKSKEAKQSKEPEQPKHSKEPEQLKEAKISAVVVPEPMDVESDVSVAPEQIIKLKKDGTPYKRQPKAGGDSNIAKARAAKSSSPEAITARRLKAMVTAKYNNDIKKSLHNRSFSTVEHACSIIQQNNPVVPLNIDFTQHLKLFKLYTVAASDKNEIKKLDNYQKDLKLKDFKYARTFFSKCNKALSAEKKLVENERHVCAIKYGKMINSVCCNVVKLYAMKTIKIAPSFLYNVGCLLQDYCYSLLRGIRTTTKVMKLKHINEKMFEAFHSTIKSIEPTNRLTVILQDMSMISSKLQEMDEIAAKKCIFPSVDRLKSNLFYSCFENMKVKPRTLDEIAKRLNENEEEITELFQYKITDSAASLIVRQMLRFLGCLAYNITLIPEYSADGDSRMPSGSKKKDNVCAEFTAEPLEWNTFKEYFDFTLYEFTDTLTTIGTYNLVPPSPQVLEFCRKRKHTSEAKSRKQLDRAKAIDQDSEDEQPEPEKKPKKSRKSKKIISKCTVDESMDIDESEFHEVEEAQEEQEEAQEEQEEEQEDEQEDEQEAEEAQEEAEEEEAEEEQEDAEEVEDSIKTEPTEESDSDDKSEDY